MEIGSYRLKNNRLLAPIASVADRLFSRLYRKQGTGLAIFEMVTSCPSRRYGTVERHNSDLILMVNQAGSAEHQPVIVKDYYTNHKKQVLAA